MRSIERTLLGWMVGALSLGLVLVTLVSYVVVLDEMNEFFDADLKNVADAIDTFQHAGHGPAAPTSAPSRPTEDSDIVSQAWTRGGQRIYTSDPSLDLPFSDVTGMSRPVVGGKPWIIYTLVRDDGVVQAAQLQEARSEVAGESATKVLPPMIALVIVVSALMVFALRRGLRALDDAARDIAARSERSLEAIAVDDMPRELLPLVRSVNGLMDRLSTALAGQRRFLADAAHELRTPATALRLQLQLLERAPDEASRSAALTELRAGMARSQRLIEQLLQVARAGPDGEPMRHDRVDLGALVRSVVGSMSAKADHRRIDLGAEASTPVIALGDPNQLTVLLNNLVENALRYTSEGGRVDVVATIDDGRPLLRVVDNGPGIAPSDRARFFDRFVRGSHDDAAEGEGSGLGLAIVKAIAERHGATVGLTDSPGASGLTVSVAFPAATLDQP